MVVSFSDVRVKRTHRHLLADEVLALQSTAGESTCELARPQSSSKEIIQSKDEFISFLTHEIRTLMQALCGAAELLSLSELTSDQRELASIVSTSTGQLKNVAESVLSFLLDPTSVSSQSCPPQRPGVREEKAHRLKILLAEDNDVAARIISLHLSRMHCDVTRACNGAEAADLAQSNLYDCIFMDCQMPVLNGYDATNRIRTNRGASCMARIVAVTANFGTDAQERCFNAGMDDFISKPATEEALRNVLYPILSTRLCL